jgi:Phage tail tube protein
MATGRNIHHKIAISHKKQADYDTEVIDGDLTVAYPIKSPEPFEEIIKYQGDDEEIGKGHEWKTAQDELSRDARSNLSMDVTSYMAAWALAFGMGSVASAQQAATAAYLHTFKFSDPDTVSLQNPVTSIVEQDGAGNKNKIRSCAVEGVTFSGNMNERIQMAIELIAAGEVASSALAMPALTRGYHLHMSGAQLEFGESGSLVDMSQRWKNFEASIKNNLKADEGYTPGCGLFKSECLFGKRLAALNFNVKPSGSTELGHWRNNTALKAVLTFTGSLIESTYYHSMIMTFENLKIADAKRSYDGDDEVINVTTRPLYTAADAGTLKIEVINTQTSFLT